MSIIGDHLRDDCMRDAYSAELPKYAYGKIEINRDSDKDKKLDWYAYQLMLAKREIRFLKEEITALQDLLRNK